MLTRKTSQLSNIIESGKQINFSFYYYNRNINNFMNSLITKILSRNNIPFLQSTLTTILRELITNAVKANSKRIYFKRQKLDIEDLDDYRLGMENFKAFIIEHQEAIEEELRLENVKVTIQIKNSDSGICITINNNVPIHQEEMDKINSRMIKAKEYHDFSDVYSEVLDSSEGEGLGILLIMLFLRNSGIGENSFKIISESGNTRTSLTIPHELTPAEISGEMQKKILREIHDLPTFPENITEIQDMCKIRDISLKKISDRISLDPSLSTSVLKLANSAGFFTRNKVDQIIDAVKIIGLKNLEALLITTSARAIMNDKYSVFKKIWDHCNKTALYARYIALKFGFSVLCDNAALGGLLHDLGKIVLLSTNKSLTEWISDVSRKKELRTSTTIEEVSIGISHAKIGELIAEKWNLPDFIIDAIRNHHAPMNCDPMHREIIYIIYLANQLCNIEDKSSHYYYIEQEILDTFGIKSEEELMKFHDEMKTMAILQTRMN